MPAGPAAVVRRTTRGARPRPSVNAPRPPGTPVPARTRIQQRHHPARRPHRVGRHPGAALVLQQWIDPQNKRTPGGVLSREMLSNDFGREGQELPVPAGRAGYTGLFAKAARPFVRTGGRIAGLAGLDALEPPRVKIAPSPEPAHEQGDLGFRRRLKINVAHGSDARLATPGNCETTPPLRLFRHGRQSSRQSSRQSLGSHTPTLPHPHTSTHSPPTTRQSTPSCTARSPGVSSQAGA